MLVTLSGFTLANKIEDSFFEGIEKDITFKKKPSKTAKSIAIKLDSINGKPIYGFSDQYHKKLYSLKLELSPYYDYYVWEEDIKHFCSLQTAEEQENYLKTVRFDGLCIGKIDKTVIRNYIFSRVQRNVPYHIKVDKSDLTDALWWHFDIDNLGVALYQPHVIKHCQSFMIEMDVIRHNPKENNSIRNKIINSFLVKLPEKHLLYVKDAGQYKDYNNRQNIYGRVNVDGQAQFVPICSVLFLNNGRDYVKIALYKSIKDSIELDPMIDYDFSTTYDQFIKKVELLANGLATDQQFYKVAENLKECL